MDSTNCGSCNTAVFTIEKNPCKCTPQFKLVLFKGQLYLHCIYIVFTTIYIAVTLYFHLHLLHLKPRQYSLYTFPLFPSSWKKLEDLVLFLSYLGLILGEFSHWRVFHETPQLGEFLGHYFCPHCPIKWLNACSCMNTLENAFCGEKAASVS